ncbi:ankyrin repeat-containing domain protein [Mycena vulgaris]|nr:ankyrin repeat-containing domain protein [Mycena vulgaris]
MPELFPELILHIASLLTRETILDPHRRLHPHAPFDLWRAHHYPSPKPQLVPDLPTINALSQADTTFYRTLNQTLYDLCASVEDLGKLALLFAVEHQLENTVDKLVAAGVSLDAIFLFQLRDNNHSSLLHIAARMGLQVMVMKLLGMYGEEMATRVHTRMYYTALDYAARSRHMGIVRVLAPIPIPGSSDRTGVLYEQYLSRALITSAQAGSVKISQYLISQGAAINFLDDGFGGTPLYCAARTGNLEIALLDAGADIHVKDCYSRSVLHNVGVELLRFFLERGVDPNLKNTFGRTPAHDACDMINAEIAKASVELLLQFGAGPVDEANQRGVAVVDLAMRSRHTEIVKILEPLVQNPNLQAKIAKWWEERKGESIG